MDIQKLDGKNQSVYIRDIDEYNTADKEPFVFYLCTCTKFSSGKA